MPSIALPPPADSPLSSITVGGEILPDVVFIISPNQSGTPILGYFCARSTAVAPQAGWVPVPANQDTWVWLAVPQPPPPGSPPAPPTDAAWPGAFYLVACTSPPPATAPCAFVATSYTTGGWNNQLAGIPNTTGPTYLFSTSVGGMGYVQLAGPTRSWYKSGDNSIALNGGPATTWAGAAIPLTAGNLWMKFELVAPTQPGTAKERFLLVTTKV